MIVHIHFHSHKTGVTKSVETIIPVLNRYHEARVFGYGISAPKVSLLSLLKLLRSEKRTVIHTHRNNEIIFALLLRFTGYKFRLVFTRHSDTFPAKLTVWLMKKADKVISLNRAMSESLPCPNTLIPHGVDTEVFIIGPSAGIKGITQKYLITTIGRIRPSKGQLVVMKALEGLLKANNDWGLIMIGKIDNEDYGAEIKSLAQTAGISSQVHFIPETEEILKYYQASRIVVIPSPSEGFSLVCLEAMACGIITVATESVGIHSEVISNGVNGFLFPKNDSGLLTRILNDIISGKLNPDRELIRKSIVENWSVEKNVKELLKLYDLPPDIQ
jgi:mannosyltransferase